MHHIFEPPHIFEPTGNFWQVAMFAAAAIGILAWRKDRRVSVVCGVALVGLLLLGGTGWL
jgi:CHASE2 domain-containing sensor protein